MSQLIKGPVEAVDTKTGQGRRGPWTLYKFKVNGQWISYGFDDPPYKVGDTVQFYADAGKGGRGLDVVKGSLAIDRGNPTPSPAPSPEPRYEPERPDTRQQSIVFQHSQEMAQRHVANLLAAGALTLSAKAVKKQAELDAIVAKYTVQFFNDALSLRLLKFVADTQPTASADGAIPTPKAKGGDDLDDDNDDAGDPT